uniref:ribosyldihydronicotinamide dehydrogenase [quinone]-like isoform X2 n=1 Tax=Myxine glutinosa TaxID=7769 RepID=UPI00358E81E3
MPCSAVITIMNAPKVLIVYAHQEPKSFNGALKDTAVRVLTQKGCGVQVSDLYAMGFKATATKEDFLGGVSPDHFRYAQEAGKAWKEGKLSKDIVEEQKKLSAADLVIFQFPMYWFSMPAILKGWMDRVLTYGFAYTYPGFYEKAPFAAQKKKAVLSFTTGGPQTMYQPNGINGDMNVISWGMQHGILHFCGFQVLAPHIVYGPASASNEARVSMLADWTRRLETLWDEKPLRFLSEDKFDMTVGFTMKPEVMNEYLNVPSGPTTGQHLGKPLPENNQTESADKV